MLILSYFHPIIGPDFLLTEPEDLMDTLKPDGVDGIKGLLDSAEKGFFQHYFGDVELNTVNYFFTLKSAWARGEEMIMITRIVQESEPNLEQHENEFIKFIDIIRNEIPELYQVFYVRNPPEGYEIQINQKIEQLKIHFQDLNNEFQLSTIKSYGTMIPANFIKDIRNLRVPSRLIHDLNNSIRYNMHNHVFTVYQYREGRIKAEMIPVKCKIVLKIMFILDNTLSPDILGKIGTIFQKYNLPIIYTSGICQQQGKCIYELYLDYSNVPNTHDLKSELTKIENVQKVKMLKID
ncbi:MAG: hypothetical protein GY870_03165 [archaeon]|nr:hypothetical protein [archaeon]